VLSLTGNTENLQVIVIKRVMNSPTVGDSRQNCVQPVAFRCQCDYNRFNSTSPSCLQPWIVTCLKKRGRPSMAEDSRNEGR